jgi:hypothetical protein
MIMEKLDQEFLRLLGWSILGVNLFFWAYSLRYMALAGSFTMYEYNMLISVPEYLIALCCLIFALGKILSIITNIWEVKHNEK